MCEPVRSEGGGGGGGGATGRGARRNGTNYGDADTFQKS